MQHSNRFLDKRSGQLRNPASLWLHAALYRQHLNSRFIHNRKSAPQLYHPSLVQRAYRLGFDQIIMGD